MSNKNYFEIKNIGIEKKIFLNEFKNENSIYDRECQIYLEESMIPRNIKQKKNIKIKK